MFAGTDMAGLRNSVRDFRKLSFMGDLDFVYIDREPKHCMIDYYFGRISCCAKLFAEMTGRHLEEVILIFADMDTVDPKRFSKLDVSTVTANHYDFNAGKVFNLNLKHFGIFKSVNVDDVYTQSLAVYCIEANECWQ